MEEMLAGADKVTRDFALNYTNHQAHLAIKKHIMVNPSDRPYDKFEKDIEKMRDVVKLFNFKQPQWPQVVNNSAHMPKNFFLLSESLQRTMVATVANEDGVREFKRKEEAKMKEELKKLLEVNQYMQATITRNKNRINALIVMQEGQ